MSRFVVVIFFSTLQCSNASTFYNVDFYNETSVNQLNVNCPLTFVAHGFLGGCVDGWSVELMNVLTDAECTNVCCLDWSEWSQCNYFNCANDYVYLVGEYLAEIIQFLEDEYGLPTRRLIGHSLGAHVIGECGRNINNPQVPECYCKFHKI